MRFILLSLISLYFLSCANTSENSSVDDTPDIEQKSEEPTRPAVVEVKNFRTKSKKQFTVVEKKVGESASKITVLGTGFPNSQEIFRLEDIDPKETGFLEDLDDDGFEELYLITRSVGSGSYATIFGYASYKDLSYGPIYIPDPIENDPNFAGYMGHDRINIIDSQLVREFPVYKEGDTNSEPSGGIRILKYALEKGEASYILKIESVSIQQR